VDTNPLDTYSLQGPIFTFVINCPPGFNCQTGSSVRLVCCDQTLVANFPPGSTESARILIINALIEQCRQLQEFCGGVDPPGTQFYYSRSVRINLACDGGGEFSYFLPAGAFIATTQEQADLNAQAFAFSQAPGAKFCVDVPGICPCTDASVNYSLPITGGTPSFTAVAVSGHVPNGMTLSVSGRSVIFSGVAATPGAYRFNLNVTDRNGSYWQGPVTMTVLFIGYGSFTSQAFTIPAINSTVATKILATGFIVGDVFRIAATSGGFNTTEYGTFEVTALDTPGPGDTTIKNLTGTPSQVVSVGATVYWPLLILPDFQQGVPYAFQLPVIGGSGSYAWKLTGDLPAGLTMTIAGYISGTPTGVTNSTFSVEVIDLECTAADRSFFRPTVKLTGHSIKTTAVTRGYDEFIASVPPKRYMVRTWSGTMTGDDASGHAALPDEAISVYLYAEFSGQLAAAHAIFSGFDQINGAGHTISSATVQMYTSCPGPQLVLPQIVSPSAGGTVYYMPGWCFSYDLSFSFAVPSPTYPKCTTCNYPLLPDGSFASPTQLYRAESQSTTATHKENFLDSEDILGLFGANGQNNPTFITAPANLGYPALQATFPFNHQLGKIAYKHSYTIDLSVEYTDAIALANASIVISNGLTASSYPRTTGYVSYWTSVTYDLVASNLVFGEDYVMSVDLVTNAFVTTTVNYPFTATGTTKSILGNVVPTPPNGTSVTVGNPRVAFATP